jgi:hypothetical protein
MLIFVKLFFKKFAGVRGQRPRGLFWSTKRVAFMKIIFLFALLILTACGTDTPPNIIGSPRQRTLQPPPTVVEVEEVEPQEFVVLLREERGRLAMYEPTEGAYLGAWLSPGMEIRRFEEDTGRSHAVYVSEIFLCEEVDYMWIFQNMAARSTPLFMVHPPREEVLSVEHVIYFAQRLGGFNLPMFVAFFPEGHGKTAAEYTTFFRTARNVFLYHAPQVAFAWVAQDYTATPQSPFFPGFGAIDWVGLPLMACWRVENCFTDVLAQLEVFYGSFHGYAPIMVLPLGISHFTRGDYSYRLAQASEEISRIYHELLNFPRVGLIVYGDAFRLSRTLTDDFSITFEQQLLAAYRKTVSHEKFLSALNRSPSDGLGWVRSALRGYYVDGEIFIYRENELVQMPPEKIITACTIRQVIFVENSP